MVPGLTTRIETVFDLGHLYVRGRLGYGTVLGLRQISVQGSFGFATVLG